MGGIVSMSGSNVWSYTKASDEVYRSPAGSLSLW